MSTAVSTLAAVRALGGDVKLGSPGRLRVIAPGPLPDELIQRLHAAKPDLLTLLTSNAVDTWTPRAWAEALARLDPGKPRDDVPPKRWRRFIDDCRRFLDARWAERAAALGWGPLHLFGCDRKRPFARVDNMGLIWFLNGGTILALHRDGAVIETRMGARQSYRRGMMDIDRVVLVWELSEDNQLNKQPNK